MVHRIAGLDIPGRLSGVVPVWAARTGCAVLGIGIAVVLRAFANLFAPGVAPYAFVYPASLLATLLGGWQAGLGTLAVSGLLAWMFVVPRAEMVGGHMHYQAAAMVIAAATAGLMIAVGEGFRAAGRRLVEERNAKLAERELMFRELQHRVGNDFALVSGLLDLQRRKSNDPETRTALEQAMARVRSISRIHKEIYALPGSEDVDLRRYLRGLCDGLIEAALPPAGLRLTCECTQAHMPREAALAVGLAANELVINAVKHAFPEGRDGSIAVTFARSAAGWRLSVTDDGIGMPAIQRRSGLGTGLIEQFVRQLGATLILSPAGPAGGTVAVIDLPPDAARAA